MEDFGKEELLSLIIRLREIRGPKHPACLRIFKMYGTLVASLGEFVGGCVASKV